MGEIQEWMRKFQEHWQKKNVENVLNLFSDSVEYYETPSERLEDIEEIRTEWDGIKEQKNISLDWEVFSSTESKHCPMEPLLREK